MRSQPLSRRYITAIQAALSVVLVLAFIYFSGGFARRGLLASSLTAGASLDLHPSLDALAGTTALQANVHRVQSPAVAFEALNMRAGGALDVTWDAQTGIPRFLGAKDGAARLPYSPTAAEQGNPLAVARGFLDENRALFRLDAASKDFGTPRMEPDEQLGFSHIRLPQVYNGVPVFGRQLVVHLDQKEGVVAVNGEYTPGLTIPSQASLAKEQAEQVALSALQGTLLDPGEGTHIKTTLLKDKTALNVYVDDAGKATLTWSVKLLTTSPLGEWNIFVNANRPVVVHAIDALDHAKNRQTYTAGSGTDIPGRLLAQEGERTSDKIGQAAHDAAGKVYDYYMQTFKRDGVDGHGSPMVSTVHYGSDPQDAENAAWIGEANQMVYGDGGTIFKPLAYGLDVVGHEFTHGVTQNTSNLNYESQSGALNESYSDVFGAMIDRANWTIGEAVVKSPPYPAPYLRSLQDPELGGLYDPSNPLQGVGQPGSMSDYANLPNSRRADNGGVHINSGIPSHAAYFVAQALGKEKMEQIYYRTLTQYLSPDSNFVDSGRASVQAATDLYGATEATAVRNAFGQVGINVNGSSTTPVPPPSSTTPGGPPSGPSSPQTPENLPAGCRELVVNGGFEGNNGWRQAASSQTQIIDPQLPHTGTQSAWLGGTDKEALQYIFQDIAVPANATSAKLTYYRLIHQEFSGLSGLVAGDANFKVLLADTSGSQIADVEALSSKQAADKWQQVQFDLARYAGQTVRLVFTADNPRGNVSSFFVDDVSLAACTTGQGPAAPSTSSRDQVYIAGHIVDADTGRGIRGAQIFILKPGVTASGAAQDGEVTDDEVLTDGTSDSQGSYQTTNPVTRGQTYSVIVIANGYRPVIADNGMTLASDAGNPTQINATMRAGR